MAQQLPLAVQSASLLTWLSLSQVLQAGQGECFAGGCLELDIASFAELQAGQEECRAFLPACGRWLP